MAGGASGKRKSAEASDIAVSKKRTQVSRRSADDKIDRCLAMHVHPFLSKQIVETEKVDGKLLRDAVAEAMEEVPGRHRLGALFWRELLRKYGCRTSSLAQLQPQDPSEMVAAELIAALGVATSIDNKIRSLDSLVTYLGFAPQLNEKECNNL